MQVKFCVGMVLLLFVLSPCFADTPVPVYSAKQILAEVQADRGHVVLVNFWATWCSPCVAEYPNLVALDRKYKRQGLDVIAVSLDFGDDAPVKVAQFAREHQAKFPQYIMIQDDPETAINTFDTSWSGDLPRTLIYGRNGHLVKILGKPESLTTFIGATSAVLATH